MDSFDSFVPNSANASLIAAAPELLAALQSCLPTLEERATEFGVESVPLKLARAAIAKATGGVL